MLRNRKVGTMDFGEVIYAYTRRQALADGVLVDCSELAREAGITFPVACTQAVWALVEPDRMPVGNDVQGRLWDLVWMLRCVIHRGASGDLINFQVIFAMVTDQNRTSKTYTLKAQCGPGDNAEPVITVMTMDED